MDPVHVGTKTRLLEHKAVAISTFGGQIFEIARTASGIFVGTWFAAFLSIKHFYRQQKTERLQKLYYENALLGQVKFLESDIATTSNAMQISENVSNTISNLARMPSSTVESIRERTGLVLRVMKVPEAVVESQKEIFIELFGEQGDYLNQWVGKAQHDIRTFVMLVQGQWDSVLQWIATNGIKDNDKLEKILSVARENIHDSYRVIQKNYALMHLLFLLVLKISTMDFKDGKQLLSLKNNDEIKNILAKTVEAFKILFGFYKINSGEFYTYATDETGFHFKVVGKKGSGFSVTREKPDRKLGRDPVLLENEFDFCDCIIQGGKVNIMRALIGLCNQHLWKYKSKQLSTMAIGRDNE